MRTKNKYLGMSKAKKYLNHVLRYKKDLTEEVKELEYKMNPTLIASNNIGYDVILELYAEYINQHIINYTKIIFYMKDNIKIWMYKWERPFDKPHIHIDYNEKKSSLLTEDIHSYFKHEDYIDELDESELSNVINIIKVNDIVNDAKFYNDYQWVNKECPYKIFHIDNEYVEQMRINNDYITINNAKKYLNHVLRHKKDLTEEVKELEYKMKPTIRVSKNNRYYFHDYDVILELYAEYINQHIIDFTKFTFYDDNNIKIWMYEWDAPFDKPHIHIDYNDKKSSLLIEDIHSYFKHEDYIDELDESELSNIINIINDIITINNLKATWDSQWSERECPYELIQLND